MLKSLRRSFGMSPSSSDFQDHIRNGSIDSVPSPSNKPNTFVPLRRSNSFTNFFSSSRPSSPVKESFEQSTSNAISSTTEGSSSAANVQTDTDAVLAYLVLLDKKGRQKERFPIQNAKTTMGRSLDNDVRFLASEISRHHCTIEIEIKQDQLNDSTNAFLQVFGANGVLLNGTQVLPAPRGVGRYQLQSGDSIKIAKRSFAFELPQSTSPGSQASTSNIFSSPVKGSAQSAVPQTPSNRRRVRMSLVNAAQINTPARPSKKSASPSKAATAERDTRRANGLQRFMQSAHVSPGKSTKNKSRQSLTSSTSATDMFGTPAKSSSALAMPSTAPPKQVSFSLFANSFTGRLSPVKQMRMMPPLDTMNEEQDASFHSENNEPIKDDDAIQEQADTSDSQQDDSSEDLVIVEELEQEQEPLQAEALQNEPQAAEEVDSAVNEAVNTDNVQPATPSSSSTPETSPSKSGSPKRAKRRSSFFGRAGPFAGINLGFYAEERTEANEPAKEIEQAELPAEEFSDASDVEQAPMEEETSAPQVASSPVARRVVSRAIGMSKTPSPVKHQHFAGLTPLTRRPRLSLASRRKVSLRTQTLLRSSEAYADRLFLPPPPSTPNGSSSLSQSMSMPSDLSDTTPEEPGAALEQPDETDFGAELDPALSEEEAEEDAWKDSEDDEDEVDQSLSAISPSPQPAHVFSPVKTSSLPKFATPQPASKTHSRRISMPPAGAADAKPSIRSTLIRLQISGAGERIVHEAPRKEEAASTDVSRAERSSPSKARKVVRVSDVGLPATELSMGFDVVQDGATEHDSNSIAGVLNDLFTAEQEELTDDEDEDEYEEQEEIVQISSKVQESPVRKTTSVAAPSQAPQTPAALNSVRHLFSVAAAAPATPDMHGLGSMLDASPSKTPRYGSLGDRMRSSPEGSELLSTTKSSPRKKPILGSSPAKGRRGVRRSQAAEVAVPAVRADAPAAVSEQASQTATEQPAFEAELHVTMLDASVMDAENEAIAQAFAETEQQAVDAEEILDDFAATPVIEDVILEEAAEEEALAAEETAQAVAPSVVDPVEEVIAEPAVPAAQAPIAVIEEQQTEEISPVEQAAPAEPSPSKTRGSRRAASASPAKRTARSASPTKRTLRSSPVKRGAAPEVFVEETAQEVVQEVEAPTEEAQPEEAQPEEAAAEPETAAELEASSSAKPTRRAGGRKAKQAATEALMASTAAQSSPEKPAPAKRGRAAKKVEAEQTHDESEHEANEEEAEQEVVEEAPKRATRARTTRAKPARTTRARATKAVEPALPSSSAGYGDDEASEEDGPAAPVKTKRATASRAKIARTAKAAAAVEASEAEEHSAEEPDAEAAPTKAKAPARTTRTKAAAAKSKSKASAAESEDATSSAAATGTTTRSGRTTRRTAK